MIHRLIVPALLCVLLVMPAGQPVAAQTSLEEVVTLDVLESGIKKDGTYLAALHLRLKPGWKTYWRAPGASGIPPTFSWKGSKNVAGVEVIWPAPEIIDQGGVRSIGYHDELVLPLRIEPANPGRAVRLKGEMDFGVCEDICVPARLTFNQELMSDAPRSPAIAAALAQRPFSAQEAGVRSATCKVTPTKNGLQMQVRLDMPAGRGTEVVVFEPANPNLWASDTESTRQGNVLVANGEMLHVGKGPLSLDRSTLRITVISRGQAVEIDGCTSG